MPEQIFVLTTDTVVGWDCEVALFPDPIMVKSSGSESGSEYAYYQAFKDLREAARALGANVVLGAKFSEPVVFNHTYTVRATGTAARIYPPLPDTTVRIIDLEREWGG